VLDWGDGGAEAIRCYFGTCGKSEENTGGQRNNGGERRRGRCGIFVVAERTGIENAACFLIIGNCSGAEVDGGFWR